MRFTRAKAHSSHNNDDSRNNNHSCLARRTAIVPSLCVEQCNPLGQCLAVAFWALALLSSWTLHRRLSFPCSSLSQGCLYCRRRQRKTRRAGSKVQCIARQTCAGQSNPLSILPRGAAPLPWAPLDARVLPPNTPTKTILTSLPNRQ